MMWLLPAILAALQVATPPPATSAATQLEDVVVNGRSLRETVEAFVDDVTAPPPGHGPARWDRRVCVGVVNLRRDAAEVLIDRVSEAASSIGLEPAGPGCSPNILVIATDQADRLTNAMVDARPLAFRPGYSGASQSVRALEAFRSSTQPIRWWHVSMPVVRDSGTPAVAMPGQDAPMIPGGGRLTTEVTNRLMRSFVILDVARMDGVTFQQVGDYVAMVTLAQIDPDAQTAGFDTVLNLFSDPDQAMTDWDRSYLAALYDSYLNQRRPNAQLGAVGSLMTRDRRNADSPTDEPE